MARDLTPRTVRALAAAVHGMESARAGMLDVYARLSSGHELDPEYAAGRAAEYVAAQTQIGELLSILGAMDRSVAQFVEGAGEAFVGEVVKALDGAPVAPTASPQYVGRLDLGGEDRAQPRRLGADEGVGGEPDTAEPVRRAPDWRAEIARLVDVLQPVADLWPPRILQLVELDRARRLLNQNPSDQEDSSRA